MRKSQAVIAAWSVLALLLVPVYPHFLSPNELTRWAGAAAIVEHRSLEITPFAPLLGSRFEDAAVVGGRMYSNKAPGMLLLTVPAYAIARPFAGPPSSESLRPSVDCMRLLGSTLPLILAGLTVVMVARRWGASDERCAATLFVALFATPLLSYGTLLFSHALTAAALFVAWALLFVLERKAWNDVAAGALIGLAVSSEYPIAVPAAILVAALAAERAWPRVARVCAGGAPFAIALAIYQKIAFGSLFHPAYGFDRTSEFRSLGQQGIFGIGLPSPSIFLRLLFDPSRGLFVFSPVLILGAIAAARARRRLGRSTWWTLVLVPLSIVILYAGYPNWHGGWAVGPRYIAVAMLFLAVPLLLSTTRAVELLLTGAALAAVTLISLTFPFPPNAFSLPWATLGMPLLAHGLVAPNLLHLVSRAAAIAVPLLLVAAVTAYAYGKSARLVLAGAVLLLLVSAAVAPHLENWNTRLQRAYIEEVYFGRAGTLGRAAPPGLPLPPRLVARAREELTLPPSAWPF